VVRGQVQFKCRQHPVGTQASERWLGPALQRNNLVTNRSVMDIECIAAYVQRLTEGSVKARAGGPETSKRVRQYLKELTVADQNKVPQRRRVRTSAGGHREESMTAGHDSFGGNRRASSYSRSRPGRKPAWAVTAAVGDRGGWWVCARVPAATYGTYWWTAGPLLS